MQLTVFDRQGKVLGTLIMSRPPYQLMAAAVSAKDSGFEVEAVRPLFPVPVNAIRAVPTTCRPTANGFS